MFLVFEKLEVKFTFCPFPKKFDSFNPIFNDVEVALEYPAPREASPVFFSSTKISRFSLSGNSVLISLTSTSEKKLSALIESFE